MSGAVATLKAVLGLDTGQFKAGIRDATGAAGGLKSSLASIGRSLGVAFSVGSIMAMGRAVVQWATEISTAAQNVGILTSEMMGLKQVAAQSGLDVGDMQKILSKLQTALYEAAGGSDEAKKKFEGMGLSVDALMKMDPAAMLVAVSKAAFDSKLPLETLNELLGERLGANAMTALKQIAEEGIPGVDRAIGESADKLRYYGDQWTALWEQVKQGAVGAFNFISERTAQTVDFLAGFFNTDARGKLGGFAGGSKQMESGAEQRQKEIEDRRKKRDKEAEDRKQALIDVAADTKAKKEAEAAKKLEEDRARIRKSYEDKIEREQERTFSVTGVGVRADSMRQSGGFIGASRGTVGIEDRQIKLAIENAQRQERIAKLTEEMNSKLAELVDKTPGSGTP